jgi:hypothetical protein
MELRTRTIQAALDRATPGTQINLAPGEYHIVRNNQISNAGDGLREQQRRLRGRRAIAGHHSRLRVTGRAISS